MFPSPLGVGQPASQGERPVEEPDVAEPGGPQEGLVLLGGQEREPRRHRRRSLGDALGACVRRRGKARVALQPRRSPVTTGDAVVKRDERSAGSQPAPDLLERPPSLPGRQEVQREQAGRRVERARRRAVDEPVGGVRPVRRADPSWTWPGAASRPTGRRRRSSSRCGGLRGGSARGHRRPRRRGPARRQAPTPPGSGRRAHARRPGRAPRSAPRPRSAPPPPDRRSASSRPKGSGSPQAARSRSRRAPAVDPGRRRTMRCGAATARSTNSTPTTAAPKARSMPGPAAVAIRVGSSERESRIAWPQPAISAAPRSAMPARRPASSTVPGPPARRSGSRSSSATRSTVAGSCADRIASCR